MLEARVVWQAMGRFHTVLDTSTTTERLLSRPLDPNCVRVSENDDEFHTPLGVACQGGRARM